MGWPDGLGQLPADHHHLKELAHIWLGSAFRWPQPQPACHCSCPAGSLTEPEGPGLRPRLFPVGSRVHQWHWARDLSRRLNLKSEKGAFHVARGGSQLLPVAHHVPASFGPCGALRQHRGASTSVLPHPCPMPATQWLERWADGHILCRVNEPSIPAPQPP